MKKLNPPLSRNRTRYFLARVVISIAFLAALIFVIGRSNSPTKAQGCTTDPVVANNLDSGAGSLRQAITDACAGSTITFNMATVTSPISLTSAELVINKNLTITGPGATTLTVERSSAPATPQFRIFNVTSGAVSISGLTVTNGRSPDGTLSGNNGLPGGNGGGIRSSATSLTLSDVHLINNRTGNGANAPIIPGNGGSGGAVFSESGSLTMTNSMVSGNVAGNGGFAGNNTGGGRGGDGGGIYFQNGTLNLTNVKITNNSGGNSTENGGFGGIGGGIYTNTNTVATLTNCTVSNNSAGVATGIDASDGFAGGINNDGVMTVIGSTISGNTSLEVGGGFLSRISLTLINSTISGNSASIGSAISNDTGSTMSLTNCTITNNSSPFSAAIENFSLNTRVRNTIIAGNVGAGGDANGGSFTSLGNNLIGWSTGFVNGVNGDQVGTQASPLNPHLGPLANNGGPTQTHALLAQSTALDAGNNCVLNNSCSPALGVSLTTDQRGAGFSRAADSADANTTQTVDIGAFEAQASVENITDKSTPEDTSLSLSFNVGDASAITNVSASSSNTVLVPNANLSIIGSGSMRTLNITPAADQSGTTTITVTVTSGAESMSDTFILTVTPVNDAPLDIGLTNNTVADNSPSNTLVGMFTTTDPDALQTFTYSLVSGAGSVDNAFFSISGDQLRTASTFDFETKSSFTIRVRSTDGSGLFVEKQFTINVVDGPDNPGAIAFSSSVFSVGEADGNANITLTRTGGADNRVVAKVNLADVTTSPADYVLAPGSELLVTWEPGDSANKSVSLPIVNDALDESNETLSLMVVLVSGGATTGVPALATLTILDNDSPTTTALSSSANPSEFGQSVTFTATVTGDGGTPTGTVQFKDGGSNLGSAQTLTAGVAQLTTSALTSGTHTITAEYSGDANFSASTGTLAGGQVVKPQPTLLIDDVSAMEGNSGTTTNFVFTVSLSATSTLTVNVNFATANGTATTSDNDYVSANGTLTFNPGDLTKTITVVVNGDQKFEADETVLVNLTTPVNAAIADAQGVGTILNDDNLQLILDESGPAADQAAALDSFLFMRDPFKVLSIADWIDFGSTDRNTRVLVFVTNLTLNQGELPSSVVVNLVDGNNQTHDVPAEDVRAVPNTAFTQVVFRLPDSLAPGVCHVTVKAQGRTSNTGTIRIAP